MEKRNLSAEISGTEVFLEFLEIRELIKKKKKGGGG
jgi:hypothetical protein